MLIFRGKLAFVYGTGIKKRTTHIAKSTWTTFTIYTRFNIGAVCVFFFSRASARVRILFRNWNIVYCLVSYVHFNLIMLYPVHSSWVRSYFILTLSVFFFFFWFSRWAPFIFTVLCMLQSKNLFVTKKKLNWIISLCLWTCAAWAGAGHSNWH